MNYCNNVNLFTNISLTIQVEDDDDEDGDVLDLEDDGK